LTFPECVNNFGRKLIEEKLSLSYAKPDYQNLGEQKTRKL